MSLLNDKEDLFLHDFSKKPDAEPAPAPAQADGTQTFEFEAPKEPAAPAKRTLKDRFRRGMRWFIAIVAVVAVGAFTVRYYVPHTTETRTRGYLRQVDKRGLIFRTFEGEMITEGHLTDKATIYQKDFTFSIPSDSLAYAMQALQGSGKMVEVTSKSYYGTLPWRGASKTVVTDVKEVY